MTKKKYTVTNMHCASCATMIELDLEDNGVTSSCSFASRTLEVEFDEACIDEEKVKQIVSSAGYQID